MTSGEVDTLPSSSGFYVLKSTVDQPAPPDTLDLPVNLVHLGWVRSRNLLMVVLRCVDHWVHKSHLVCKGTRNCVIVEQETTNSSRLGWRSREQRNFSSESDGLSRFSHLNSWRGFRKQDGIWWSTGKFDSSTRFKFEDVELDLPFFDFLLQVGYFNDRGR